MAEYFAKIRCPDKNCTNSSDCLFNHDSKIDLFSSLQYFLSKQKLLHSSSKVDASSDHTTNTSSKSTDKKSHSSSSSITPKLKSTASLKVPLNVRQSNLDYLFKNLSFLGYSSDDVSQLEQDLYDKSLNKNMYKLQISATLTRLKNCQTDSSLSSSLMDYDLLKSLCIDKNVLIDSGYPIAMNCNLSLNGRNNDGKESVDMVFCLRCRSEFIPFEHYKPIINPTGMDPVNAIPNIITNDNESSCNYHWSKLDRKKKVWLCCGKDQIEDACSKSPFHVYSRIGNGALSTGGGGGGGKCSSNDPLISSLYLRSDLFSFPFSFPSSLIAKNEGENIKNNNENDENDDHEKYSFIAMDGEMIYTTMGVELARLSFVDWNENVILDVLIEPVGKIVDWNSRFSGLNAEMIDQFIPVLPSELSLDSTTITSTSTDTHSPLLEKGKGKMISFDNLWKILISHYIKPDTIILGHSLENDLHYMGLEHWNVIDTTHLFPHKSFVLGSEGNIIKFKYSLKILAKEKLGLFIQESTAFGHSSVEDSKICLKLLKHYISNMENDK